MSSFDLRWRKFDPKYYSNFRAQNSRIFSKKSKCLKIIEKVSLHAKWVTYTVWVDKSSLKKVNLAMVFKAEACGHKVLPDKSILIRQKMVEGGNCQNSKSQMRHFIVIFDQCENVSQNVTHSLEDLVDAWRPNKLSFFHLLSAKVHQYNGYTVFSLLHFLNEEMANAKEGKRKVKLLDSAIYWALANSDCEIYSEHVSRLSWQPENLEKSLPTQYWWTSYQKEPPTKKLSADIEKKCKYIFNSVHHSNILISQYSRCLSWRLE